MRRLTAEKGMFPMETQKRSKQNMALYSMKEALCQAVMPVLRGNIAQLFLLSRGASTAMVGYYGSMVTLVQMAMTMLLSGTAEKVKDARKFNTLLLLLLAGSSMLFLPVTFWDLGAGVTLMVYSAVTVAQISFSCRRTICDFKVNYQIIRPEHYGTMVFLSNALAGITGIAFSGLFSLMIDTNLGGRPYFICMILTVLLLLAAMFLNTRLKPIYPAPEGKKQTAGPLEQIKMLMKVDSFRKLVIPNLLRGVTLSVTGSIVLIATVMGIDESGQAKIPLVCAVATFCASGLYVLLSKKLSVSAINIIGSVLLLALLFLPRGNSFGFLTLYLIAHLGRILVDNAIPTMIFDIIDPKIAGSYHAWRSVLYNASWSVFMPIVGTLVEIVHPMWILVPGAVTYVIVTIWYHLVCRSLKKA